LPTNDQEISRKQLNDASEIQLNSWRPWEVPYLDIYIDMNKFVKNYWNLMY
jgi:hypothetical protein